jgi:hypothetical protein
MVMDGEIVILKGAWSARREDLIRAREGAWNWSRSISPIPEPDPAGNCHCLQAGISRFQKTPHIFHSYNFNRLAELPSSLEALLTDLFGSLADLHRSLTGNSFQLDVPDAEGRRYHPQLIQYPAGGGLFGRHVHPFEPQRIGMVTSLSQFGTDHPQGATGFESEGVRVVTEGQHDLGDIVLFRYDLPHWVSPSDTGVSFDWDSSAGRWTMVLPFY